MAPSTTATQTAASIFWNARLLISFSVSHLLPQGIAVGDDYIRNSPVLSPKDVMSSCPSLWRSVTKTLAIGVPSGAL